MQVTTEVTFKRLRDPFDWEMDDGRKGTSFSMDVYDEDGQVNKVKIPEDVYNDLKASPPKNREPLKTRLIVRDARLDGPDGIQRQTAAGQARAS